ncbi:MAG: hypothetical protein IPM57_09730 [Oligoflexia bacterium]|nr:hypothetical protein [Oligoflexia bacterium]
MAHVVNLGKQHLNKFINSGALLSTPRGTYFVGIGLSGTMEPNCACFYAQEFFTQPKAFKCEQFLELTKEKLCEFLSLMPSRQDVLKFKEANKEHFLKKF